MVIYIIHINFVFCLFLCYFPAFLCQDIRDILSIYLRSIVNKNNIKFWLKLHNNKLTFTKQVKTIMIGIIIWNMIIGLLVVKNCQFIMYLIVELDVDCIKCFTLFKAGRNGSYPCLYDWKLTNILSFFFQNISKILRLYDSFYLLALCSSHKAWQIFKQKLLCTKY